MEDIGGASCVSISSFYGSLGVKEKTQQAIDELEGDLSNLLDPLRDRHGLGEDWSETKKGSSGTEVLEK